MSPAFMPAVTASPAGSIPRTTPGELGAGRPARHPGHRLALLHPLADGGQRLDAPSAGTRMMRWVV